MTRSPHLLPLFAALSASLLIACGPVELPEESLAQIRQNSCAPPSPQGFNQSADVVIRTFGQNGTACQTVGGQSQCLSYSTQKPSPVSLGDNHAAATEMYLCSEFRGELSNCSEPPPQGYHCEFGGNCVCGGLIDCLFMLPNCAEGTLVCIPGISPICACDNVDGC